MMRIKKYLGVFLMLAVVPMSFAGIYTVTSLDDNTNVDSVVTLREAILWSEGTLGSDMIYFHTNLVSGGDVEINLTMFDSGEDNWEMGPTAFLISDTLSIIGPSGENGITIRCDSSNDFRFFHVTTNGNLTVTYLTFRDGIARGGSGGSGEENTGGGGAAGLGGAVLNQGAVSVHRCAFFGNQAIGGDGGLAGPSTSEGGGGAGSGGGGVAEDGFNSAGANGGYGGDPNNGYDFGGDAGTGGGGGGGEFILGAGPRIGGDGGTGGFGGGGGGGGLAISWDPAASAQGGGGGNGGFGGGGGGGASAWTSNTTHTAGSGGLGDFGGGNGEDGTTSHYPDMSPESGGDGGGGGAFGGAIFNYSGTLSLWNSTFAGNSAIAGSSSNGGGGSAYGGAIASRNGTIEAHNCTIVGNTVTAGTSGATNGTAEGGGIFSIGDGAAGPTATLTMTNCIIANTSAGCSDVDTQTIRSGPRATTGKGNLIESYPVTALPPFGEIVATTNDPNLGPLSDNGGSTETYSPLPGSPAIDGGTNVTSSGVIDQRGVGHPRLVDGDGDAQAQIDIGAVEFYYGIDNLSIEEFEMVTPSRYRLGWPGATDRLYRILYKTNFLQSSWQTNAAGISGGAPLTVKTTVVNSAEAFLILEAQ